MFDFILIALGVLVLIGMALTIAMLWGLHSMGMNFDWNLLKDNKDTSC
jgi:hypothetical protein